MRHQWRFRRGITFCARKGCNAIKSQWSTARSCREKVTR